MAWKLHSQALGTPAGEAIPGEAASAASGADAGGDGASACLANVRLRLIAFLNNVLRASSLRDPAPQTANKANTVTERPTIELELTEGYLLLAKLLESDTL